MAGQAEPEFSVLFVCTGNICRSPLAERLSRVVLGDLLGDAAGAVRVVSAGTGAVVGHGMEPLSARMLERLGGDPAGFSARQLTDSIVASADLVLTMSRAHRADVLGREPRALLRTFTLREAAQLAGTARPPLPCGAPVERARALVAAMAAGRAGRRSGPDDDIPDPIGQSEDVHSEVAHAVAGSLPPVLTALAEAITGRPGRDAGEQAS